MTQEPDPPRRRPYFYGDLSYKAGEYIPESGVYYDYEVTHESRSRRALARKALESVLRRGRVSKYRLLEIADAEQHRVGQVIKTKVGPVFVSLPVQHFVEHVEEGDLTVGASSDDVTMDFRAYSRTHHEVDPYVDILMTPSALFHQPDSVPIGCAQCRTRADFLSVGKIKNALGTPGAGKRVLAQRLR